jgi:hypothetical protein
VIGRALLTLAAIVGPAKLPPIDECAADPSFVQFRAELLSSVEKRDVRAILDALDDRVLVDFGGGEGKAAFRSAWRLHDPEQSKIWGELKDALSLGCAIRGGVAIAPSLSAQLDPDADPYETVLAKPGGTLRNGQSQEVLGTLEWDLLTIGSWPMRGDLIQVKLADGRMGYVKSGDVRGVGDYRLNMEKRRGVWRITAFVAGD